MKYLYILCTLFLSQIALAQIEQTAQISGKITDKETGESIIAASVMLYKNSTLVSGTNTDLDGCFVFDSLTVGNYVVESNYIGYQNSKVTGIQITNGAALVVNMQVNASVVLEEVCIVGYKVPLVSYDNCTQGATIVSKDNSRKAKRNYKRKQKGAAKRGLPSKNISSIAASSAGVTNSGNVSVSSSRSDGTFYYIDGVRVSAEDAKNLVPGKKNWFGKLKDKFKSEAKPVEHEEEVSIAAPANRLVENAFISPVTESHSTFSLDVDKASYSNVRRYLQGGSLPPSEVVRVEEMINYFNYNYDVPTDTHPLAINTNYTSCPWNGQHQLLHVAVKAKEVPTDELPPSNLVFLIDVSGSMGSANKLGLLKESFKLLVDKLRPEDKVAIVTYAGHSGIPLPSTAASQKEAILNSLANLRSGGGTAGAQGIITAYDIATNNFIKGGNNRVILATDGDFNIGISNTSDLEKLIEKKRESGVFLSVLGFGMGNYQDHKMQALSSKGNGNHSYIDNLTEAKKVLVNEFGGTLFTVAKDVKIQIEFNPAYVQSYRLLGYENRMLAKEDFNDDKKDAGEVGSGHTVTAIYEIIPAGADSKYTVWISDDELANSRSAKQGQTNGNLAYIKCRYKQPDGKKSTKFDSPVSAKVQKMKTLDEDVQFSIAVAEFGLNIGQSSYLKSKNLSDCINRAVSSQGEDKNGYRHEFIQLVKSVKDKGLVSKS